MGHKPSQIPIEERWEIARLHTTGQTLREIAAALDRTPSTITREVKGDGSERRGYQSRYADLQAQARCRPGSRLGRNGPLRDLVLSRLKQGRSPEQVSGGLAREAGRPVISHESIYRFIPGCFVPPPLHYSPPGLQQYPP